MHEPRFTEKAERINVSLPADMVSYLRLRKIQDGIPISVQVRRAIETDVMDRAVDTLDDELPERTAEEIEEFLYGPQRRAAAGSELIDGAVEYETHEP